jgi:hypothetical protein
MKLTLVKGSDNHLYIDGVGYVIDTSSVSNTIHAIQWNEDKGEIEYIPDPVSGIKPPNEPITSTDEIDSLETLKSLWQAEHDKYQEYLTTVEYNPKRMNKTIARKILNQTDWVEMPSVTDTSTKPFLTNKAEFDSYRARIRALLVDAPDTLYEFPAIPSPVWQK